MLKRILLVFLALYSSVNHADVKDYLYNRYLSKHSATVQKTGTIKTYRFRQLIDHHATQAGYFWQRYYVDTSFSTSEDDPIFLYICGEATCRPKALSGAIRDYAQRFHAKLVALEHRYYGKSIPNANLTTANLRYLSTEQALADLQSFQGGMLSHQHWSGKWVVFGGSYAGALSAYYRATYPELVVGSLASSAPVEAREDFSAYDAHLADSLGEPCLAKLQQVVHLAEAAMLDAEQAIAFKARFKADSIHDNDDFLYALADIAAMGVQYGDKATLCHHLLDDASPLDGFITFAQWLYNKWDMTPETLTAQSALSTDPEDYVEGFGMRAWMYQSCTEYGFWQTASPKQSARSHWINLDYHHRLCQRLFQLNTRANTASINQRYLMKLHASASTSRVIFSNGSDDPWSELSLATLNGNADNPNHDYIVIENAAHCEDLHKPLSSDSQALENARHKTEAILTSWLGIS